MRWANGCFARTFAPAIFEKLDSAKALAAAQGQDAGFCVKDTEFNMMRSGTSTVQGYTWQFHTGRNGVKYQAKRSVDPTQWNLRARVSALFLAVNGFQGATKQIYDDLAKLEALIVDDSVSSIDFCADLRIDPEGTPRRLAFDLIPSQFIFHSKSKRREFFSRVDLDSEDLSIIGGRYCETVAIGSKASRQITVYNKRSEQIAKRRGDWFGVWGIDKAQTPNVWRVEYRFGRNYLRDFNIRSLQDLEDSYGDLLHDSFKAVRYTQPTNDSNQSRWPNHPFWESAIRALTEIADNNRSGLLRGRLTEIEREDAVELYKQQVLGNIAPLAVCLGMTADQIEADPQIITDILAAHLSQNKDKFCSGMSRTEDRLIWTRKREKEKN